jgi:hypothetical protein
LLLLNFISAKFVPNSIAMGLPLIIIDGVEADDVIGTLTTRCTQILKNWFKWLEFKTWLGGLLEAPAVR